MADRTPAQKIAELTDRVRDLEAALDRYQSVTDLALKTMQAELTDRKKSEEEFRKQIVELQKLNATLEERARHQEKQSDRGFNFVQAVIISVISMIGGALLSQLFKK